MVYFQFKQDQLIDLNPRKEHTFGIYGHFKDDNDEIETRNYYKWINFFEVKNV